MQAASRAFKRFMNAVARVDSLRYDADIEITDTEVVTALAINGVMTLPDREVTRHLDVYMNVAPSAMGGSHAPRRLADTALLPLTADQVALEKAILFGMTNAYMSLGAAAKPTNVPHPDASRFDALDSSRVREDSVPQRPIPVARWQHVLMRLARLHRDFKDSSIRVSLVQEVVTNVSHRGIRRIRRSRAILVMSLSEHPRQGANAGHTAISTLDAYAPPDDQLADKLANEFVSDFQRLRVARDADAYAGPILLEGDAAPMFLHQVLGHRAIDQQGMHLLPVGEVLLPADVHVIDDPLATSVNARRVLGGAALDDTGAEASRAVIVRHGAVMAPAAQDGRQRRQRGFAPQPRQTNIIAWSSANEDQAHMRERFMAEVARSGRPYGVVIRSLGPDPVFIGRKFHIPILFMMLVHRDGTEEVVRSGFLESTSLADLSNIVIMGGARSTLNIQCRGASGVVTTSASSPAILFSVGEISRMNRSETKERR